MHAQTSHSTGVPVPSRGKQFAAYVPHKFVHGAYTSSSQVTPSYYTCINVP